VAGKVRERLGEGTLREHLEADRGRKGLQVLAGKERRRQVLEDKLGSRGRQEEDTDQGQVGKEQEVVRLACRDCRGREDRALALEGSRPGRWSRREEAPG
jgi:hypothetical protein